MDRRRAVENVMELQEIFVGSFAVYGTALGALREKNIIEHDLDTDIGIKSEHFTWEYVNRAIREGFRMTQIFGMRHYGMEMVFYKHDIKTDVMLFYTDPKNKDMRFNCLWKNGGRNGMADQIVHEYPEELLERESGTLADTKIWTLGEPYVRHVYGPDWVTPKKQFNWETDHLCKKTG